MFGIGLLSRYPIASIESFEDPSGLELTVAWAGHETVVIAAHPLPATIRTSTGLRIPTGYDPAARDLRLRAIRTRIDAALRDGADLVVLGDFNTAPTEPAYQWLVAGLSDAHVEVGQGPGWSWRPGFLGTFPVGLVRIDLILSSPRLRPATSGVMCPPVGDHCMVRADLNPAR